MTACQHWPETLLLPCFNLNSAAIPKNSSLTDVVLAKFTIIDHFLVSGDAWPPRKNEKSCINHKHTALWEQWELSKQGKKRIFATSKHHNIMTHFIAPTGTVYGARPQDNPAWPSRPSDWGAIKTRPHQSPLSSFSSLVICSVCSTNFPVLQAYRDQCSELCPTSTYLMELVTMPQSSGLTDPITPPLSFRGEIAPSDVRRKTPRASPRV